MLMCILLFIIASICHAEKFCGQDLNNNGYLGDQGETIKCVGTGSDLCPLSAVECIAAYGDPICPIGSTLNTTTDKCEKAPVISCNTGYAYNDELDICTTDVVCPNSGTLNPTTDLCEIVLTDGMCPSGYTFSAAYDACIKNVVCDNGSYNATRDKCEHPPNWTCPTGYSYNGGTDASRQ